MYSANDIKGAATFALQNITEKCSNSLSPWYTRHLLKRLMEQCYRKSSIHPPEFTPEELVVGRRCVIGSLHGQLCQTNLHQTCEQQTRGPARITRRELHCTGLTWRQEGYLWVFFIFFHKCASWDAIFKRVKYPVRIHPLHNHMHPGIHKQADSFNSLCVISNLFTWKTYFVVLHQNVKHLNVKMSRCHFGGCFDSSDFLLHVKM